MSKFLLVHLAPIVGVGSGQGIGQAPQLTIDTHRRVPPLRRSTLTRGNEALRRTLTARCASSSRKATGLKCSIERDLNAVADELNDRSRKVRVWRFPTETFAELAIPHQLRRHCDDSLNPPSLLGIQLAHTPAYSDVQEHAAASICTSAREPAARASLPRSERCDVCPSPRGLLFPGRMPLIG